MNDDENRGTWNPGGSLDIEDAEAMWMSEHPPLCPRCKAIAELITAYRKTDPPDIAHRIYVDIETILDPEWYGERLKETP